MRNRELTPARGDNLGSLQRVLIASAATLIAVAGVAKLVSSTGSAAILDRDDPIFSISFRAVFIFVGSVEIIVAAVCFFTRSVMLHVFLLLWLASAFVAYRAGLWWIGYLKPCPCLGTLTERLHLPPVVADKIVLTMLLYLFFACSAVLFLSLKERREFGQPAGLADEKPNN